MRTIRSYVSALYSILSPTSLGMCLLVCAAALTGCSSGGGTTAPATPATASVIATQPVAQSVFVGDTATFSVVASGTAPLTYQWSRGGTSIASATSASYTTPALVAADDGATFTVTVSNSAGSVTSSSAKLSVTLHAPTITTGPAAVTITAGQTATFSVVASGTAPLTYQWLRGGGVIAGATSASYSLANAQLSDSGSAFSVKVSNGAGSVTSATAALNVNAVPVTITAQPIAATQFVGETAMFSVTATGTSVTYQWRKNAANIAGATGATYTTPVLIAADNNATFDVVVSNTANSVGSSVVTLHVGPFATVYTTQQGVKLNLFAWPGTKNAVLTKTAALDPVIMRKMLNAADGTWNYYAGATGKLPSIYFNYNGLATIADTGVGGVDLCGDGCTFIGSTGMEISDNSFGWLYGGLPGNVYDQVIFYEFGRSFWTYGNQLEYKTPDVSSCMVTGFAVLMRYRAMSAQGFTGAFGGSSANYTNTYNVTLGLIDSYAANTSLTWNNTFRTDTYSGASGLGCSDLFTSMTLRLAQTYGGEAFIQALYKEAAKRPSTVTTQDAVDNFILAASAAANHNLTSIFQDQWRWPVSTAASAEAMAKWGKP